RGYAGQVSVGTARAGDPVVVLPSGVRSTIERIDTADGSLGLAQSGRSVTLVLADDLDVSRGDVIASVHDAPEPVQEFAATVCWLAEKPLRPGARVLIKHGTRTAQAVVDSVDALFDDQSLTVTSSPDGLALNDIGLVHLRTADP